MLAVPPSTHAAAPVPPPEQLPGLIWLWVSGHLGPLAAWLLIPLSLLLYLWRNWGALSARPGVKRLLGRLSRKPLPRAARDRFSIAVAHLEHDKAEEHERLIVDALLGFHADLAGGTRSVEVLRVDRTLSLGGTRPEQSERAGHEEAAKYLGAMGADVLIWGTVLRKEGQSIPRLYWTSSRRCARSGTSGRYLIDANLTLPPVFWSDLIDVLRLLAVSHYTELAEPRGHYIADRLRPFIHRVSLLLRSEGERGWSADARADTRFILGNALQLLGTQAGDDGALREAVDAYRQVLREWSRGRAPLNWAAVQNNLGNVLAVLGEREGHEALLRAAVAAYQEALSERTRERAARDWATTQNNLGNALATLARWSCGGELLREAVDAYREALGELTRERDPLGWAALQNNLGNALASLGEERDSAALLEEAVGAYRAALRERTREQTPLCWAATQNNLGTALAALGGWKGTGLLEEAVAAYREALRERTRERTPLDWAVTRRNLGHALAALGRARGSKALLEEAVVAYRAALGVWSSERAPVERAFAERELADVLVTLGSWKGSVERLEEAAGAYREALRLWTRDRHPQLRAIAQAKLGEVLATLGELERSVERLEEAVAAYREALRAWLPGRDPLSLARLQNNLAVALLALGRRRRREDVACEALSLHAASWEVLSLHGHPDAANAFEGTGEALQRLREDFGAGVLREWLGAHPGTAARLGKMGLWALPRGEGEPPSALS